MLLNDNTIYNTFTQADLPTGGDIGTSAATTVDISNYFVVNQTTTGQTLTLFTPTDTSLGQPFYVHNIGTAPFVMYGVTIDNKKAHVFVFNGTNYSPINTEEFVNVIVFNGESNSGGLVPNASASAPELAPRNIQILNNTTLKFEPLDVGTNNLIGHTNLPNNATHGWEVGLANIYDTGFFNSETYIVKTGQGSSQIAQWINTSDPYFVTFKARMDATKAYFKSINKTPIFYVWYSQGINDADNGTNINTWFNSTKVHFDNIRKELGFCPIIMTKLMTGYSPYNIAIDSIVNSVPFVYSIDTSDLTLLDPRHWSYTGMKTIAERMSNVSVNTIGEKAKYILKQNYLLSLDEMVQTVTPSNTVWTQLQVATDAGGGVLSLVGGVPSGGTYNVPINTLNDFEIEATIDDLSATSGVVVYLDTDNTLDYDWAGGVNFLCGMFQFGGDLHSVLTNNPNFTVRSTIAAGNKMRLKKSGNDIILSKLTGGSYIDVYTFVNILVGVPTLYLKTMFAIGGTKAIKVTIWTESNLPLQTPPFSTVERNALTGLIQGDVINNTSLNKIQRWSGTVWESLATETLLPGKTNLYGFYDFLHNLTNDDYLITVSGTGAASSMIAIPDNETIGLVQLTTGTTAAGRGTINSNINILSNSASTISFESRFRIPTLNNGTDDAHYRIGMGASVTGESVNGFYLRYNTGSGNFFAVSRKGNLESSTNTTIPVIANQFYKVKILANTTNIRYYIDDVLVATITTNLPSVVGESFGWIAGVFKSLGTTARTLQVDYVEIQKTLSR